MATFISDLLYISEVNPSLCFNAFLILCLKHLIKTDLFPIGKLMPSVKNLLGSVLDKMKKKKDLV